MTPKLFHRRVLIGALIALWGEVLPLHAAGAGSRAANFLKIGVGGRGVGMGDAQTAAVDDASSLYWNPAGLGGLTQDEALFMHSALFQGVNQETFYIAHPTARRGTWGYGVSLLRVGDIAGFDDSGAPTGSLNASDSLFNVAWGKSYDTFSWLPGLQWGVQGKYIRKTLDDRTGTGFMADMGWRYRAREGFFRGMKTALVFQNVGPALSVGSEKTPLPRDIKMGAAYPLFGDNLTFAADAVSPSDRKIYYNLGADYRLWDILSFRVGYKGIRDLDSGLTYGVKLGNERLHLDYAFVPFGNLGDSHRVSLSFRFGKTYRRSQVQDQIYSAYEKAEARYGQGFLVDAFVQAKRILEVAPWHTPSKILARRVEDDFKAIAESARKEQLQSQIDEHYTRCEQLFQTDDLLSAREECNVVLALQSAHTGARAILDKIDERYKSIKQDFYETAMRYVAAKNYKDAKAYLEKVLAIDPDFNDAHQQLIFVDKLISAENKEMDNRLREEKIAPLYKSALDSFETKKYDEALRLFEEVLAVDAEHAEAKRYRGLCKDLLAKDLYSRGMRAAQSGEKTAAYDLCRRAFQLNPAMKDAQACMERLKGVIGEQNREESRKLYRAALEDFLSGKYDDALKKADKALELDPENLEAKRMRERIMQSRGSRQP